MPRVGNFSYLVKTQPDDNASANLVIQIAGPVAPLRQSVETGVSVVARLTGPSPMRICIFGAGAVGSHFAVRLALSGHDVSCVMRGPHLEAVQARGLKLRVGRR